MARPFLACAVLSVVWVLGVSRTARAEAAASASPPSEDTGLAVYAFGGHNGWNASALEAPLAAMGYSSLSADPGSGGIGLRAWHQGWMGGLEFQLALSGADAADGRHVSLDAGQVMFHVGHVIAATRHLRTYALAGVGYGVSTLTLDAGSLPGGAANGLRPGSAGASNFALAVQTLVGVDYLVPLGPTRRRFNAVLFGLRAGYNLQPSASSWTASSGVGAAAEPVGLPRVVEDGPFLHLVLGDVALGR
jgi:hypothetical protein